MYQQFTTELLELTSFQLNHAVRPINQGWIIELVPNEQSYICPLCLRPSINHSRSKHRILKHLWVSTGKVIYVQVPVHRQRCHPCSLTWTVKWPGIPERGQVTEHFKRMVSKKCIGQSFEGVARELQLPASTVAHWFYEYADEALAQPEDYEAPKVVCLDEFALKKGHHYSVAILDAESGHVWHASPGKSREKIQAALRQYPFETAPEVVITDMAAGMDKTVHEVWPDAAVVVDKFHVIQLFTQALSSARKLEQSVERKFKRIRHQRRLLMTDPAHLENEEQEQLTVWLQQNQKLQTLYEALQDIRLFYASESYEQAESRLERWLEQYMYAGVSKLTAIGNTLLKWRQELMNYFYHRWTNAKIEGTNNLIKTLKRRSFGCPNLHKFVKRIRLECRQPA